MTTEARQWSRWLFACCALARIRFQTHQLIATSVKLHKMSNANAHRPTLRLRLELTVTSGATGDWMARGSHSFTCHPHVYPRIEWTILHAFRKHSPDGVAWARWRSSESAYYRYSSIDPLRMKGWVGLVGWPFSRWFTHIKWSPISYRSSVGQGKFAGHRPTFYHWATQPTLGGNLSKFAHAVYNPVTGRTSNS